MIILVAVLTALKATLALLGLMVSTVALVARGDDVVMLLGLVTVQTTILAKTTTLGAVLDLALVLLSRKAAGNVMPKLLAEVALNCRQVHLTLVSQMTGPSVASSASVKTLVGRVVVLVANTADALALDSLGLDRGLLDMTFCLAVSGQTTGVGADSTILGEDNGSHIGKLSVWCSVSVLLEKRCYNSIFTAKLSFSLGRHQDVHPDDLLQIYREIIDVILDPLSILNGLPLIGRAAGDD